MTPKEIQAETQAITKDIGSQAESYVSINAHGAPLHFTAYPHGIIKPRAFSVDAADWPELFAAARAKWAECSDRVRAETIRKMALAIIRITAEQRACTDAALRQKFAHEDVARYADDAVADANAIAANGPFAIVQMGGANNLAAE